MTLARYPLQLATLCRISQIVLHIPYQAINVLNYVAGITSLALSNYPLSPPLPTLLAVPLSNYPLSPPSLHCGWHYSTGRSSV